jgi:hypothetical protein
MTSVRSSRERNTLRGDTRERTRDEIGKRLPRSGHSVPIRALLPPPFPISSSLILRVATAVPTHATMGGAAWHSGGRDNNGDYLCRAVPGHGRMIEATTERRAVTTEPASRACVHVWCGSSFSLLTVFFRLRLDFLRARGVSVSLEAFFSLAWDFFALHDAGGLGWGRRTGQATITYR